MYFDNLWAMYTKHIKAVEILTFLRIYCHVPSWASQLQSLAVRSVSLCAPPTDRNNRHGWRRQRFGRFCAYTVTCPREPVSFSRLLHAVSLCAPPTVVPDRQCISKKPKTLFLQDIRKSSAVGKCPTVPELGPSPLRIWTKDLANLRA
jgi:hypothetical protein